MCHEFYVIYIKKKGRETFPPSVLNGSSLFLCNLIKLGFVEVKCYYETQRRRTLFKVYFNYTLPDSLPGKMR